MKIQRTGIVTAVAVMFGVFAATGLGCELVAEVDRSLIDNGNAGGGPPTSTSTTTTTSTGMGGMGGMGGAGGGTGGAGVGGTGGTGGAMPTCMDMTQNGAETDVDCGGGTCPACAIGMMCGVNSDCTSNNCMAGVCAPPPPTCMDMTQNGAETDVDCGGGTCPTCADGMMCGVNSDCTSNNCMAGVCAPPLPTCMDGMMNGMETDVDCGGPVCPMCVDGQVCGANSDCTSDYCKANVCSPKEINGTACTDASECGSGFCVDGFCCESACDGTCQTCANSEGSPQDGTCGNVANGTDPNDSCNDDGPDSCGNDGMCNSAGQCRQYPAGTACGDTQSCMNGVETKQDTCNGAGMCINNGIISCGAYVCDPNTMACKTMCTDPADCAMGFTCNGGACLRLNGTPCTMSGQCNSGNCVDNVCCDTTCTTTCMSCNVAGNLGTCTNVPVGGSDTGCSGTMACNGMATCLLANGQPCTMPNECASNNCDGFTMTCAP